jgi:hypothetical protein
VTATVQRGTRNDVCTQQPSCFPHSLNLHSLSTDSIEFAFPFAFAMNNINLPNLDPFVIDHKDWNSLPELQAWAEAKLAGFAKSGQKLASFKVGRVAAKDKYCFCLDDGHCLEFSVNDTKGTSKVLSKKPVYEVEKETAKPVTVGLAPAWMEFSRVITDASARANINIGEHMIAYVTK